MRQVILPKRRSAGDWTELRARSEKKDLWVEPQWHGKPELGPWVTGDGQRVVDVIADGHCDSLPYDVCFEQSPNCEGTRRGDILWIGGLPIGIVSSRFIRELHKLDVAGWSTYPVAIKDTAGQDIEGYHGLVADVTGNSELVSGAWKADRQAPVYLATDRVAGALLAAGVDGLDFSTATKRLPRR